MELHRHRSRIRFQLEDERRAPRAIYSFIPRNSACSGGRRTGTMLKVGIDVNLDISFRINLRCPIRSEPKRECPGIVDSRERRHPHSTETRGVALIYTRIWRGEQPAEGRVGREGRERGPIAARGGASGQEEGGERVGAQEIAQKQRPRTRTTHRPPNQPRCLAEVSQGLRGSGVCRRQVTPNYSPTSNFTNKP